MSLFKDEKRDTRPIGETPRRIPGKATRKAKQPADPFPVLEPLVAPIVKSYTRKRSFSQDVRDDLLQHGRLLALEFERRPDELDDSIRARFTVRLRYGLLDATNVALAGGLTGVHGGGVRHYDIAGPVPDDYIMDGPTIPDSDFSFNPTLLVDLLSDDDASVPEREVLTVQMLETVAALPKKQANILLRYYGLMGTESWDVSRLMRYHRISQATAYRRIEAAELALKSALQAIA